MLVTTLTKKMAEALTEYFHENGLRVRYMHSDVDTLERIEIIRDLRLGVFDVLVGINLLREGLDIPECALVAILDADKEGYLRSRTALIQTIGRAARNLEGRAILYADRITDSMKAAIDETNRRREKQQAYNAAHGITPESVRSAASPTSWRASTSRTTSRSALGESAQAHYQGSNLKAVIADLEKQHARRRRRSGIRGGGAAARRDHAGWSRWISACRRRAGAAGAAPQPAGRSIGGRAGTSARADGQAQGARTPAAGPLNGPRRRTWPQGGARHRRRPSGSAAPSRWCSPTTAGPWRCITAARRGEAEAVARDRAHAARRAVALPADLDRRGGGRAAAAAAAEALGPLGLPRQQRLVFEHDEALDVTRDSWDRHIETNLRAPFVLMQAFRPRVAGRCAEAPSSTFSTSGCGT